MRSPTSPASPTCGGPARTRVRTATGSSTVTSASPSWPPATAASTSPCCCANGQTTSSCQPWSAPAQADQLARVEALDVPVIETPVVGLDGDSGRLRRVRLDDGQTLDRDALFF